LEKAKLAADESSKRIGELNAQLSSLRGGKPFSEITIDEELAANPELAASIKKDIEEHKWQI
jgi:hypothetical protein